MSVPTEINPTGFSGFFPMSVQTPEADSGLQEQRIGPVKKTALR
jgi:hypothetical protein